MCVYSLLHGGSPRSVNGGWFVAGLLTCNVLIVSNALLFLVLLTLNIWWKPFCCTVRPCASADVCQVLIRNSKCWLIRICKQWPWQHDTVGASAMSQVWKSLKMVVQHLLHSRTLTSFPHWKCPSGVETDAMKHKVSLPTLGLLGNIVCVNNTWPINVQAEAEECSQLLHRHWCKLQCWDSAAGDMKFLNRQLCFYYMYIYIGTNSIAVWWRIDIKCTLRKYIPGQVFKKSKQPSHKSTSDLHVSDTSISRSHPSCPLWWSIHYHQHTHIAVMPEMKCTKK